MNDYETYTKEKLIKELESLKRLHRELLLTFQETEKLEFGWTGNLGQWFWDFTTNEVTFNPLKATTLGYLKEDLPEKVPFQFFTEKIHEDEYESVMDQMQKHLSGETPVWEVKYRIQAIDGSWKVYRDRGKVTERDEKGNPLFLKGIVFDVTEEEAERDQLMLKNTTLKIKIKIDSLTSLYTRPAILLELGKRINKSKETNQRFSLMFLRVDTISQYEEGFSSIMNDENLKEMGDLIASSINKESAAGRYRDNIFMLVLEHISLEEAEVLSETLRKKAQHSFLSISKKLVVSAGISTYCPTKTASELIEETAEKLLAAQRQGGNKTVI
ncbi:sensor domain-containing diguanylate cyclase [Jeotgalibaca sp. MA1X17-3]|uniref:sensor domain-containing diguanylate cyclase n=1 Tax=Jeotgalibaca sp. MA1X17-3 TaxID=2908211 RepID=UPI001F2E1A6D|nr:sensor domain-containing diguanylate cyclase [Jeotgalibaca sp. MA1X17-3]UJF16280.1 sensor domain-containing diguanylate cyclase [Jeotgalibaca sp. MA1X17-3]